MVKRATRSFNTSGPNIPEKHYTLPRTKLVEKGVRLVQDDRYFTIWAPRQTGKSTYFLMLAKKLETLGFHVVKTNLENFKNASEHTLLEFLTNEFRRAIGLHLTPNSLPLFHDQMMEIRDRKIVLIIDEIEGLNPEIFGQFLHTIRNLYHFRDVHALKSVILVGVSNIVGVVQDHASPFNIADNLEVPYFTTEETSSLLGMHEKETGQLFHRKVKQKIAAMTGNQPGLVNGFANQLVERNPGKEILDYDQYLAVEHWYLNIAIDKNISNIINKAKQHRMFVENLLFSDKPVKFTINDEKIKFLTAYGVIKNNEEGFVVFNVPLYKKALLDAFYPHSNGESKLFFRNFDLYALFSPDGGLKFDPLIENYREYVKRRSFRYFRAKDEETGKYKSIKEAALAYSFETYIQTLVQALEGKSYLEPHSGLGIADLIINIRNREYVVEFKIFRDILRFEKGKQQIASYCNSIGVKVGVYLVFVPNTVTLPQVKDQLETVNGVEVKTYTIFYDEEKEF